MKNFLKIKTLHGFAQQCFVAFLLCAGIAGLSSIREGKPQRIWPIRSAYLMPNVLAIFAYIALGMLIIAVVVWLVTGDKNKP